MTQLVVMAVFVVLTILAFKRFHGEPPAIASGAGLSVGGATGTR
jgi:multisubunit Na+/H+ antiporter MnhB subunit